MLLTFVVVETEVGKYEPPLLPEVEHIRALFVEPSLEGRGARGWSQPPLEPGPTPATRAASLPSTDDAILW